MQMYLVLKAIFVAQVLEDALSILLLTVALVLLVRRRARKHKPELPREVREDLNPPREVREDLEAWRRLQNYNAGDAYGTGGGG